MSDKLPAYQFYPADWLSDPALRSVGYAARGLWKDCMCLMHKSERRGYLQLNGRPVSPEQIARMTGGSADEVVHLLQELQSAGVSSATEDGILFSRRMVADEHKRKLCADAGKRGGNPALKGRSKGQPTPRVKRNVTPSSSASSSPSRTEETTGESGAVAPPTGTDVIVPKPKTPQAEFVLRFAAAYKAQTGMTYHDTQADYVIAAELLKKHSAEQVIQKAGWLAVLCKKKSAWFTKDGWSCFTIKKLSDKFNEIQPDAHQLTEQDEAAAALQRQEDLRARAQHV